jgi:hypothetical protein
MTPAIAENIVDAERLEIRVTATPDTCNDFGFLISDATSTNDPPTPLYASYFRHPSADAAIAAARGLVEGLRAPRTT